MKFTTTSLFAFGFLASTVSTVRASDGYFELEPPFAFDNEGVPPEMVGAFAWEGSITEGWAAGSTFKNMHLVVNQQGYYQMTFVIPQTNFTRTASGKSLTYECVEGRPGHWKGSCSAILSALIGNPPQLSADPTAFCHYVVVSQPNPDSDEIFLQWWDSNKYCNFTYEDLIDGSVKSPSWMYKQLTPKFAFDDGRPACGYATEVVPVPGGGQLLPIAFPDGEANAETKEDGTPNEDPSGASDTSDGNRRTLWFLN